MKKYTTILLFIFLNGSFLSAQQQLVLKKGNILDSLSVNEADSGETFALYLPTAFEVDKTWPLMVITDMEGRGRQAIRMLQETAEKQGYVLASSNNLRDTLSLTQNMQVLRGLFNKVVSIIPVEKNRIYVTGFDGGGKFASVVPLFIKGINGVISWGADLGNIELLTTNNTFHYIGVVERTNYNFPAMLNGETLLNKLKYPNQLLVIDDLDREPQQNYLERAFQLLNLQAMAKGYVTRDESFVTAKFENDMERLNTLLSSNRLTRANDQLELVKKVYGPFKSMDSLNKVQRTLKRNSVYRNQTKNEGTVFFKESLLKEEYAYYMEEDILTYNFKNLGWWNYQMEELEKFNQSPDKNQQEMGKRLNGYVNALIEDNIDFINSQKTVDEEALSLLWMIKTLSAPKEHTTYFKIISSSAKKADYGTALFYLEELLKNGYSDKEALYKIENTALLRITPEFNELIAKYLKEARYEQLKE